MVADYPQALGLDGGQAKLDGCIAREGRQRHRLLAPGLSRQPANQDGCADGDDDQADAGGVSGWADSQPVQQESDSGGGGYRHKEGKRRGNGGPGDQHVADHAAQHHELALSEVDDAGDVEDNGEADGYDGIDASQSDAGYQVLRELLYRHQ